MTTSMGATVEHSSYMKREGDRERENALFIYETREREKKCPLATGTDER